MKNSTDKSKLSFKEFFGGMTVIAIMLGGFCLAARLSGAGNPDFQAMRPIVTFLLGFLPVEIFALVVYMAVRDAGHKDGVPIR